MIVRIDKSFQKDVSKINDPKLKESIIEIISSAKEAENLSLISNLKKLTGYRGMYRIRLGNYRVGLKYTEEEELIFIRFLHLKEIYKRWP